MFCRTSIACLHRRPFFSVLGSIRAFFLGASSRLWASMPTVLKHILSGQNAKESVCKWLIQKINLWEKKHRGRINPLKSLSLSFWGKIWIASLTDILSLAAIISALLSSANIRCSKLVKKFEKMNLLCDPYKLKRGGWLPLPAVFVFSE